MRRGYKSWAEDLACQQRIELGLKVEAALPAHRLAEHLGALVIGPREIPGIPADTLQQLLSTDIESWSATTIVRQAHTLIIHNTAHAPRRQESNLMHELAHLLCRHSPSHMVQAGSLPFALRTYDQEQEDEAAWLGGCLQLPRAALVWAVKAGMNTDAIAQYYCASKSLVTYRRGKTGVDIQTKRRASLVRN